MTNTQILIQIKKPILRAILTAFVDNVGESHLCLDKSLMQIDKEIFIEQIIDFIIEKEGHQGKNLNNLIGRILGVLIFCFEKSKFVSQVLSAPRYVDIPAVLITQYYELNVTLFSKV